MYSPFRSGKHSAEQHHCLLQEVCDARSRVQTESYHTRCPKSGTCSKKTKLFSRARLFLLLFAICSLRNRFNSESRSLPARKGESLSVADPDRVPIGDHAQPQLSICSRICVEIQAWNHPAEHSPFRSGKHSAEQHHCLLQ